jgi:hypothetical protein
MNIFIWKFETGFYADGVLVAVSDDLSEAVHNVRSNNLSVWVRIQTEGDLVTFNRHMKQYLLENLSDDMIKQANHEIRDIIMNGRETKECRDLYASMTVEEYIDDYHRHYRFISDDLRERFIEKSSIKGISPWFLQPEIKSDDEIFYQEEVN